MISGFIAQKRQMTSVYTPDGQRIGVTKCSVKPLTVIQTSDKLVEVAFGQKKKLNQSVAGRLKKLKLEIIPSGFKQFKKITDQPLAVGDQIAFDSVFQPGNTVQITGTSKGHGFAGVIKRWGFQRQPVTGGQSDRVRAPGAIGAQTPGKVLRGKKMPGHYGNVTKTIDNLKIFSFDKDQNQVLISGSVPGHFNSWIVINQPHEN